jgi:hypothetical protein
MNNTEPDIWTAVIGLFFIIGVVTVIAWMVSLTPFLSFLIWSGLTGFSSPYTFEDLKECDMVSSDVFEGSEYFIVQGDYYPKALWEKVNERARVEATSKSGCENLGLTWKPINARDTWIGDCYHKYWSCFKRKVVE